MTSPDGIEYGSSILGYPRIGAHRELKAALEGYWHGSLSRDELLARYRLVPDHPCLGYAKDYVAAGSVVSEPEGWRWKFDRTFAREKSFFDVEHFLSLISHLFLARLFMAMVVATV